MKRVWPVLARIAGSSIGFLTGWLTLGLLVANLLPEGGMHSDFVLVAKYVVGFALGLLIGAPLGATVGATIMLKVTRRRSSFWKGLLGAVVGLLTGLLIGYLTGTLCPWAPFRQAEWLDRWWPFAQGGWWLPYCVAIALVYATTVAGAVVGSGWRAKPTSVVEKEGVPPALD
jgi:hypothetical protein